MLRRSMLAFFATTCAASALVTPNANAARPAPAPSPVKTFYAEAAFGEIVDIMTHGSLTLVLDCRHATREDNGFPIDLAILAVRTNVNDMVVTSAQASGIFFPAGDTKGLFAAHVPPGLGQYIAPADASTHQNAYHSDFNGNGASAATPDGTVLTVPADSVGFGIGLYRPTGDHGWRTAPDCFVSGTALLIMIPSFLP